MLNLLDFCIKKHAKYYYPKDGDNGLMQKVLRFLYRNLVNFVMPVQFSFSLNKPHLINLSKGEIRMSDTIISITTFPDRINDLWLVLETLSRQNYKPANVIVWLSKQQFEDLSDLPQSVRKFINRGLQIQFVDDDMKSHKKYIYCMELFPKHNVITVDDDIFYPSNFCKSLFTKHCQSPKAVICNYASTIKVNDDGKLLNYADWPQVRSHVDTLNGPLFFGTGGGTFFPPGCLFYEFNRIDLIKKLCFNADDIWLNVMVRLQNSEIIHSDLFLVVLQISNRKTQRLFTTNIFENDKQIRNVINYFQIDYSAGLRDFGVN